MEDDVEKVNLQSIKWSFLARTENCPVQQWHMDVDNKDRYFMVMPLFPFGKKRYYSLSVVKGSQNIKYDSSEETIEQLRPKLQDILHLRLKVGQVLVAHANLWHRGGPNSKGGNLVGTKDFEGEEEYKIPAIKNLSIHGYLKNRGTDIEDATKETTETQLIELPKPEQKLG